MQIFEPRFGKSCIQISVWKLAILPEVILRIHQHSTQVMARCVKLCHCHFFRQSSVIIRSPGPRICGLLTASLRERERE